MIKAKFKVMLKCLNGQHRKEISRLICHYDVCEDASGDQSLFFCLAAAQRYNMLKPQLECHNHMVGCSGHYTNQMRKKNLRI